MPIEKRTTDIRQHEIAKAALELIGTHGMKGLRMAAIAKKVGIVPSGIYRHFSSKDEVLDAILDFIQDRFSANARAVSKMEGSALDRLHALLMKHVGLIRENESIPVVVFSADVYTDKPWRRTKLRKTIESYLAEIASIVEQGQREGVIRGDVVPSTVAVLFMGLIQPPTLLWHLSAGRYDVAEQAEAAWPMFCRAIGREARPATECANPEIVNTILYCTRWQETIRFYRDVIGFRTKMEGRWLVEFEVTEHVCLSVADETATSIKSAGGAGITITFKVADIQGVQCRLTAKGVAVSPIRQSSLGGQAFFLYDPEGNRLEFWSDTQPLLDIRHAPEII